MNETSDPLENQRNAVASALFAYSFLVRFRIRPQSWQTRLGLALVNRELKADKAPEDTDLSQVYETAEVVKGALDFMQLLLTEKHAA